MKKISLLFLFAFSAVCGQTNDKTCALLGKITLLINREHFKPKPVDDSLSVFVFDSFIDQIDENRNLFTKAEYETLRRHRLTLDDEINDLDCAFLGEFADMYRKALQRKKQVIENIAGQKLDFSGADSIRFIKNDLPFDLTEETLERVWKKRIRFDILEDVSKSGQNLDSIKANFDSIEKAAAQRVFQNYLCKTDALLENRNGLENELASQFLDVFCTYFDPHTNYFALDAKTSFMSALSTSNLSLGLELGTNENEEIVVAEIIPGGPAAQSRQFEKDDVIVKVSDKDGRDYIVSCTPPETIGDIIFSDANREIKLTIRKKNGTQLDVALVKQVMKATENSVYSFIAEKSRNADQAKTRVGYIKIPSFYSDFEGYSPHGLAEDVAIEIEKLSRDGIDGLVIDLQDNGGGSMEEAVRLAGLFIESGAVAVSVDNHRKHQVLRDYDRGIYYGGPLIILINGASASASEFFAGAMQDYRRGLIIGATSLGKATVQTILPLDSKQQEFVKVTVQKFYRVTGESGQIKGIVPDISLPVLYDSIMPREKSFKTALKYDFIKTNVGRIKKYGENKSIVSKSISRVAANSRFNEIAAINKEINAIYNDPMPPIALRLDDVFEKISEITRLWNKVKQETGTASGCLIINNSYDAERISGDALLGEINSDKLKDAQDNPYLEEALDIVTDWKAGQK